jgi:hypothetical protein
MGSAAAESERRRNLAGSDCDRHLVKVGRGLHLVMPAEDVTNAVDPAFALPASTVVLVSRDRNRPRPCSGTAGRP